MSLLEDLSSLETAKVFGGNFTRLAYPIIVDGYDTSGLDPSQHHIIGRRADPFADQAPVRVYLDQNDPTQNNPDPKKRRPTIADFEFAQYAAAVKAGDVGAILSFANDRRTNTFTEIGGMVLADRVQEGDDGSLVANWISPLRRSAEDTNHRVLIGWGTVRARGNSVDAESIRTDYIRKTKNINELRAALMKAFEPTPGFGKVGVYLRLLVTDQSGNVIKATILGGRDQDGRDSETGGRIVFFDKKVGNTYVPRSAEECVSEFLGSGLGKLLASRSWGDTEAIEVLPISYFSFGAATLYGDTEGAAGNGRKPGATERRTPEVAFLIPAEGEGDKPSVGFTIATLRVSAVKNRETQAFSHYAPSRATPINGELFRLADIATEHYTPSGVEPAFARFERKQTPPAADGNSGGGGRGGSGWEPPPDLDDGDLPF